MHAGYECFNIVSPTAVWYLDCTGSGNETISHLREPGNGRLTISASSLPLSHPQTREANR